ncbi:MAG: SagB/ThcOx family dehydrogenase, partial [Planctomycetes bacterium]|nr:SagB/ThcOx family dehydrogenase [Planctomycetota bacterium]
MTALSTVFAYHERTKHHFHRYAQSLGYMDWANQPHPFRYYQGASETRLALDREPRPLAYDRIYELNAVPPARVCLGSVADLFRYSMALTAWKQAGTSRWALRVNPSSGNLHPTESYLIIGPQASPGIKSGLYHYDSYHHALELRRLFGKHLWKALACGISENGFFIGLSSIYWREAWKYGERAYRYCHHDVGHALGAITIAAASLGWQAQLIDSLTDKDISIFLGIEDQVGIEAEHADCLVVVYPNDKRAEIENNKGQWLPMLTEKPLEEMKNIPLLGEINQLSENHHEWPIIDEVSLAARKMQEQNDDDLDRPSKLPLNASVLSQCNETAFQIIRHRRSAVAM